MAEAGERTVTVLTSTAEQLVLELWASWVQFHFNAEPELLIGREHETGELVVIDIMGERTPDEVEARFVEAIDYFNLSKTQQAEQKRDS